MTTEPTQTDAPVKPITSLDDPRVIQILSTEHWSLLGARSLAYNEAFIRGGMFLTFLSMSFVALALLAQGMSFGNQFLTIAAVVLAFDFVIGLTTYGRISGANVDDLRAVHGMARIRHAYTQIAPITKPYFTSPTHDDVASVISTYGTGPDTGLGLFFYAHDDVGGDDRPHRLDGRWCAGGGARPALRRLGRPGGLDRPCGWGDRVRRHRCRDARQRPAPPGAAGRPVSGPGGVRPASRLCAPASQFGHCVAE